MTKVVTYICKHRRNIVSCLYDINSFSIIFGHFMKLSAMRAQQAFYDRRLCQNHIFLQFRDYFYQIKVSYWLERRTFCICVDCLNKRLYNNTGTITILVTKKEQSMKITRKYMGK